MSLLFVRLFACPTIEAEPVIPVVDTRPVEQRQRIDVPPRVQQPEQVASLSAEALFKKASPAVDRIETQTKGGAVPMLGSGFLISDNGLIVTNHHVIRGAASARVFFGDSPSSVLVKGVTAIGADSDLALLKANCEHFPFFELDGKQLPAVGSKVFAIGSPKA